MTLAELAATLSTVPDTAEIEIKAARAIRWIAAEEELNLNRITADLVVTRDGTRRVVVRLWVEP